MIQPEAKIFEILSLLCSSGINKKTPDVPFRILNATFRNVPRMITRAQLVATMLLYLTRIVTSTVASAKALGFADFRRDFNKSLDNDSVNRIRSALAWTTLSYEKTRLVKEYGLSRLFP